MAKITVQQISHLAKKIRKKHPSMKWINAIKEASRQLKSGKKKVGATLLLEKRETRKTKPKRIVRITRKGNGTFKSMQRITGTTKGKHIDQNKFKSVSVQIGSQTTGGNIYWKKVRDQKIPFIEKASYFITLDGRLINWEYRERFIAQRWLKQHKSLFK